ncbi:MAG: hypothetical protein IK029_01115, partial [Oscillospiraceae bacterium]|nr:hypothetical protein [Oscillospiraceae bacterium]
GTRISQRKSQLRSINNLQSKAHALPEKRHGFFHCEIIVITIELIGKIQRAAALMFYRERGSELC